MSRGRQAQKFLTPSEAAGRLGCTPRTLATWADKGALGAGAVLMLPSGHRRYVAKAIDARARKAVR